MRKNGYKYYLHKTDLPHSKHSKFVIKMAK